METSRRIHLTVLTPEEVMVDVQNLAWVKLRLADGGMIGILPGHAPLIARTAGGLLSYGSEVDYFETPLRPGILHVSPEEVAILTVGLSAVPGTSATGEAASYTRLIESLRSQTRASVETKGNADGERS